MNVRFLATPQHRLTSASGRRVASKRGLGSSVALLAVFLALPLEAETIADWNLSGVPNEVTPTVAPTTLVDGLSSSGLLRGPGVNPNATLTNGYSATGFSIGADNPSRSLAISTGQYLGFDVTVQTGYVASLEAFDVSLRRSAFNGPMFFELQYSFDNFATPGTKVVDFTYRGRSSGTNVPTSTNPAEYMKFGAPDSYTEPFDLPPDLAGQSGGASDPGNPMPTIDLSGIAELQNLPGGTTVTFGLFAWGNDSTTATNSVAFGRVHGPKLQGTVIWDTSQGVPLEVRSDYVNTDPTPGTYTLDTGTEVTATASVIEEGSGSRVVPTGWTGTGSIAEGEGSSVTFTLNEPSILEWLWKRENQLDVTAAGNGEVSVSTTTREPLLGFNFAGYLYLASGEYADGQYSNENGVPASTVGSQLEPSTITRGWGLTPANLSVGAISSSNWNFTPELADAVLNGKFYEFNVTPKPGASLEVNSIFVPYRFTGGGPRNLALAYSFDNFSTYTVAESLVIHDGTVGTQLTSYLFVLPDDPALGNVTTELRFRIYGWGGSTSGGTLAIYNTGIDVDDLVIFGGSTEFSTVTASESFWIDETSVIALEASAAAGSIFTGWSGSVFSNVDTLRRIEMAQARSYTANFEAAADGLIPDSWKATHLSGLADGAGDDPDGDGFTNLQEYRRGTDPAVGEELVSAGNVMISPWENPTRDPLLPGGLIVRDFGGGFRGVWDGSNHNRSALLPFMPDGSMVPAVPNVSFDGPRMIVREEAWQEAWSDSTVETVFSVGDNDGTALYFRYQDELNWYRVTVAGESSTAEPRPLYGVSVQKRVNGVYSSLGMDSAIGTDPNDGSNINVLAGYKQVRVSVEQSGPNLTVRVIGWDVFLDPPAYNPNSEVTLLLFDESLATGRAGVGTWAQGGAPADTTHPEWNTVTNGTLFQSFRVVKDGAAVFEDDWSAAPLAAELPPGWENAFAGVGGLSGNWRNSAHGTIAQANADGEATSSTETLAFADADGPVLLAPETVESNYVIDLGLQIFNDGAAGFVFDYVDSENYGRVLFANIFGSRVGSIPSGVVVSRKQNGNWTDLFIADGSFVFTPARPIEVSFSRSGSDYTMTVRDEGSSEINRWQWTDASVSNAPGRHGLATWQAAHTHFEFLDVFGAVAQAVEGIAITGIEKQGEMIVLSVDNPSGDPYLVERSTNLIDWVTVATDETASVWTGDIPAGEAKVFWRIVR